jgi:hypothetical protein
VASTINPSYGVLLPKCEFSVFLGSGGAPLST